MMVESSKRAPVQAGAGKRPAGSISWEEHVAAWTAYRKRFANDQSAERIAQRGGFGYDRLVALLGGEPATWSPR